MYRFNTFNSDTRKIIQYDSATFNYATLNSTTAKSYTVYHSASILYI